MTRDMNARGLAARAAGQSGDNSVPGLYNFKASNTAYIRTAIGRVLNGQAHAKAACIGDSTMLGVGSQNSFWSSCKYGSWPRFLAKRLQGRGMNIEYGSSFGDGGGAQASTPVTLATVDSNWTLGSGWAAVAATSLGSRMLENTTTTNAISYTPPAKFDTADIYYVRNTGYGQFTVTIGGTLIGTFTDSNGSGSIQKLTVTTGATAAVQSIAIARNGTGSNVRLIGIEPYDNSVKSLRVANMGWSGSASAPTSWGAKSAFSDPMWAIGNYAPDWSFLALGINDETLGVTNPTFESQMGSIITNCMNWSGGTRHSDVILLTQNPVDTTVANGFPSAATQAAYRQSCFNLMSTYDLPLVDTHYFLDTWANRNSFSGVNFDSDHLQGAGYAMISGAVLQALAFCGAPM